MAARVAVGAVVCDVACVAVCVAVSVAVYVAAGVDAGVVVRVATYLAACIAVRAAAYVLAGVVAGAAACVVACVVVGAAAYDDAYVDAGVAACVATCVATCAFVRVAAGVAHEIGNPLAAIKGYLSLLKRGLDPKEQEDVVQRCVTELDRIHDTIRQLLTYARKKEAAAELVSFEVTGSILDILTLIRSHPALCDIDLQFAPSSKVLVIL